jgi:hypothetical protein
MNGNVRTTASTENTKAVCPSLKVRPQHPRMLINERRNTVSRRQATAGDSVRDVVPLQQLQLRHHF